MGDGLGDGLGVGEGAGFGSFFSFGAGSEPDGENDASSGGSATETGVTADGADPFESLLPVVFPIANAAPKATSAATTAMAMSLPWVIRGTSCAACWSPG